ncbi:unnamed protein product, partial [Polarella glacialis]
AMLKREEAMAKAAKLRAQIEEEDAAPAPASPAPAAPEPAKAAPAKPAAEKSTPAKPSPAKPASATSKSKAAAETSEPKVKAAPKAAAKSAAKAAVPGGKLPSEEEAKALKVTELKETLKSVGLKVGGAKAELLQRLLDHIGSK